MPDYRRAFEPGGTFFFTAVTHHRQPILCTPLARACLREAWRAMRDQQPLELVAHCLLPDHLHMVWTLPPEDSDYSARWRRFKALFSKAYREQGGQASAPSAAAQARREAGIWQRRFWEHTVRDEEDLYSILEYVHYNPVHHGLVTLPWDWPFSSFRRYVADGWHAADWGETEPSGASSITEAGEAW